MANLYDKASLVLPTSPAYKDGAIQAYKPLTSQGTFDFTRGSNLAATRVDVNGLIEKGRENLFTYSNDFSQWGKPNSTLAQGFSGYDGSNNAWKWSASVAGVTQLSKSTTGVSGMRTLSLYAKAGSRDVFSIWVGTGIDYNLTTGQVVGHANASMESVGNGWWRCSYFNDYGTLNPYFVASAAGEFIYIMNAQAEMGLVATDYIETGASTAQAGILEDMPRLDYSGGASCPALLLEPQRTNVIASSEYLSDWGSTIVGTGVTPILNANASISPEGVQNAYEVTFNSGAGTTSSDISMINYNIGGQGTGDYVLSFYAKVSNGTDKIIVRHAGGFQYTTINLTDKWQRFFVKENLAVAGTITVDIGLRRGLINEPLNSSVTCQIYGLQLEAGSYPTSYIPTYGSSVTRGEDDCNKTGISSLIGQTEGVLFVEFEFNKDIDAPYRISLSDGTSANRIQLGTYGDAIQVYVQTGGATQVYEVTGTLSVGTTYKAALAYKANDYVCYLNGSQLFTDTSASVPACSKLGYEIPDGTGLFEHPIKQQVLFPTRLTNAELASLTTL